MASPDPDARDLRLVMRACMTNMGTPRGFVRVAESRVLTYGFTAEEARAWVIEHDGHVAEEGPRERTDVGLRPDRFIGPPAIPGGVVYFLPVAVVDNAA
jgi:hypothetical protein